MSKRPDRYCQHEETMPELQVYWQKSTTKDDAVTDIGHLRHTSGDWYLSLGRDHESDYVGIVSCHELGAVKLIVASSRAKAQAQMLAWIEGYLTTIKTD